MFQTDLRPGQVLAFEVAAVLVPVAVLLGWWLIKRAFEKEYRRK